VIPYGRQDISDEDIKAVVAVLRSDFITQGPSVTDFEQSTAKYCGSAHAIAVNSATSALHIACLALGVGPGDLVWTSPITFVASSNCALYCGADVDFVDVDDATANMSVDALAAKLAEAETSGRLPKVVIPVHLCGTSCNMKAIRALGDRYGFRIIEDASHAIGGHYLDAPVGSCAYSDITVFSFHPVKIITTGEGGMAVTNDAELAQRMGLLRSHGVTRDPSSMTREGDGPWYYQQVALGFNYRITDIQAALGLSQMSRLDAFVARRHEIADWYDEHLATLPLQLPVRPADSYSALHLYVIRVDLENTERTHREVFESLREQGIGVNLHYIPVYTHPYYEQLGFKAGLCPTAERYYERAISIPMFPNLTTEDLTTVRAALERACA
jgi:UDP-4-amino-4,6-dideoxy-N-acetyl-beta-L-altrosamine transaminase